MKQLHLMNMRRREYEKNAKQLRDDMRKEIEEKTELSKVVELLGDTVALAFENARLYKDEEKGSLALSILR